MQILNAMVHKKENCCAFKFFIWLFFRDSLHTVVREDDLNGAGRSMCTDTVVISTIMQAHPKVFLELLSL